jgi:hypothetical protein
MGKPIPRDWYFKIDVTCVYFYLCDFDRCDPLVLALYGDVIIFARCPRQLMRWCETFLVHDINLRDVGVGRFLMI